MSLFNRIVPKHALHGFLVAGIRWGIPCDPDKKYPLTGRLYYSWMGENYDTVKLLLREGEGAWSNNREAVIAQAKGHETFISLTTLQRDPTFVVAEFGFLEDLSWIKKIPKSDESFRMVGQVIDYKSKASMELIQKTLPRMKEAEEFFPGLSLTRDPFDIFDEELKLISQLQEQGVDTPAVAEVKQLLKDALDQADNNPDETGPIIIGL